MRLIIDLRLLKSGLGGGQTFADCLIPAVVSLVGRKDVQFIYSRSSLPLKGFPYDSAIDFCIPWVTANPYGRWLSNFYCYFVLGSFCLSGRPPSVVWHPFNTGIFPVFSRKVRRAVTIHDTLVLDMPHLLAFTRRWGRRFELLRALNKSDLIISISNYTFTQVSNRVFGGLRTPRMLTIYNPLPEMEVSCSINTIGGNRGAFLLSVGVARKQKNLPFLVRVLSRVKSMRGKDLELIIVGKIDAETKQIIAANCVKEGVALSAIRFAGFVDKQELANLYGSCGCFVFPSVYEGFGYPVVEACLSGASVVASSCASLLELKSLFPQIIYSNPFDADDFANKICAVLERERTYRIDQSEFTRESFSPTAIAAKYVCAFDELVRSE